MDANDKKLIQLLERWQSGDFTRSDEQELQRLLAESDGFSREAAEGMLSFPEEDYSKRFASIRKKLPHQNDRPNAFFSGRMTALAASFALLLVAAWWLLSPGGSDKKVAVTAPELQQSAPGAGDNNTAVSSDAGSAAADRMTPSGSAAKSIADSQGNLADGNYGSAGRAKMAPGAPVTSSPAPEPAKQREGAAATPVSSSEQETESLDDLSVADTNADRAKAKPAAKEDLQPFLGNVDKRTADEKKVESFEQNQANIPKVSSTPVNTYPNAPATASNTGNTSTKKARNITAPAPAGGWTNFRNEMSRQMTLPQKARDNGLSSGKVTMILDIGPLDGKVRSVIFTSRFGFGCDELAEAFVQKFNWVVMPGGPTEVEVDIQFK